MKREQYCFTIGYNGDEAIVDRLAMSRYGKMSARELVKEGLFKSALAAALYDNDQESKDYVLEKYNEKSGASLGHIDNLVKVLGIIPSWNEVTKVRYV